MSKIQLTILFASITLLGFSQQSHAQGAQQYFQKVREQVREEISSKAASRAANLAENKCDAINARIRAYLNNLDTRKDNHIQVYRNRHEKLTELSTRLQEAGHDTAKLNTDLATLDTMIDELEADYTNFKTDMQTTLSF